MSRPEDSERSDTQSSAVAGVTEELGPDARDVLGALLGVEPLQRESLIALARRWPTLAQPLRDAVLRVAGIERQTS